MGGSQPPFMYGNHVRNESQYSGSTFDPKAITRASWEPKPARPKQDGPLLSVNRHPDTHMVLSYRSSNFTSMKPSTKKWIKGIRWFQLALRVLQLNAAVGLLVLLILLTKMDTVMGWIMRITPGVVALHSAYAIHHLSRDAANRAPGSSAAYQLFSAMADICALAMYAFGAYTTHQQSAGWATRLADQGLVDVFVPAVYYTYVGAGGTHVVAFSASLWLYWMFRRISLMPPDMNPLEDNLTARPRHKRLRSSVTSLSTTTTAMSDGEKRLSTPLESHRRSGVPYEDISRPPSVPFMHTRTQSRDSLASSGSRVNLPTRHYQVMPSNSPRHSVVTIDAPQPLAAPRSALRGSYAEVPVSEPAALDNDQDVMNSPQRQRETSDRAARFTETWLPTSSLISRTKQKNQEMMAAAAQDQQSRRPARSKQAYAALTGQDEHDSSDSDFEAEVDDALAIAHAQAAAAAAAASASDQENSGVVRNPLRAHPTKTMSAMMTSPTTKPAGFRAQTPFVHSRHNKSLSELSPNHQQGRDLTGSAAAPPGSDAWSQHSTKSQRARYSRPYGELKSATPPVMVGSDRKVSSGNDYYGSNSSARNPSSGGGAYGRRNVSGKVAEEGRANERTFRDQFFAGRL